MIKKDIDYRVLARKFIEFLKNQEEYKQLEKIQKTDEDLLFDFDSLSFYLNPDSYSVDNTVILKKGSDLII